MNRIIWALTLAMLVITVGGVGFVGYLVVTSTIFSTHWIDKAAMSLFVGLVGACLVWMLWNVIQTRPRRASGLE